MTARLDALVLEDLARQRLPGRYLAASLDRAGLRARLVHWGAETGEGEIVAVARESGPRLVVGSVLFADRVPQTLQLMNALRAAGVGAHLALAGPLPTLAWAELLAACPALDSVLRGEPEAGVVELARRAPEPARWPGVPGLAWRSTSGLSANPLPGPIADLDALPFPWRGDGLPSRLGYGFATLEASRGCCHACSFCLPCAAYRAAGPPFHRLRSIQGLVDEVEALHRQGARLFLFDDEQFLPAGHAREERVASFGRELERRGLRIAFTIKCRPDDVEAGLFRRLQAIGLLRVYVGVESGCQATLDLLDKGVTTRRNAEALAALDRLGLVADFRSLLFHPWTTLETVRADLGFLESLIPHLCTCLGFHEVQVFPGTPLAARLRAEGRGEGDPWPMPYALADPRAELLRTLCRAVFGATATGDLLTQAWFDLLLEQRFLGATAVDTRARRLKAIARMVNQELLLIWREMLALAAAGEALSPGELPERANAWAGRVHAAAGEAGRCLARLGLPLAG